MEKEENYNSRLQGVPPPPLIIRTRFITRSKPGRDTGGRGAAYKARKKFSGLLLITSDGTLFIVEHTVGFETNLHNNVERNKLNTRI